MLYGEGGWSNLTNLSINKLVAMPMLEAVLVFILGLIPPILSFWIMRKAEVQARESLRAAIDAATLNSFRSLNRSHRSPDSHYVEGVGYMMGDLTCRFNARSHYIRCAVNPQGPCQACPHYESIELA